MDDERFDRLTLSLTHGASRRGIVGLALTALGAMTGVADTEAKRKKKKKKKKPAPPPPGPTCKAIQKACSFSEQDCCNGARCGYNSPCHFQDVCFQEEGGPCADRCDCRGDLVCDQRGGNVCSTACSYPTGACDEDDDCCLSASTCGNNVCGGTGVCCQAVGAACADNCDCCAPHFCNERTGTCGNCAGIPAACQRNDDCCSSSAICGTDFFERPNRCCEPVGGDCAFNEMCCDGLVCNPFQKKCVAG